MGNQADRSDPVTRGGVLKVVVALVVTMGVAMGCEKGKPGEDGQGITPAEIELPDLSPARPHPLAAFGDQAQIGRVAEWEGERIPLLKAEFSRLVYGELIEGGMPTLDHITHLDVAPVEGAGAGFQVFVTMPEIERSLDFVLILPEGDGPFPVVINYAFCGNKMMWRDLPDVAPSGNPVPMFCERMENIPGRAGDQPDPVQFGPPVEALLAKGYGVLTFNNADVVPDDAEAAVPVLERLSATDDPLSRAGAIAGWAWGTSRVLDVLERFEQVDMGRIALVGHSRNGKATIYAAVFDPRIALIWVHQSGTGGATLSRTYEGEAVENITGGFPHWFAPRFREYAGREEELPVDQHQLLAMVAPRPVILGGAVEDTWAGPEGAFASAIGADPIYELYGAVGLDQPDMWSPNYEADIAYFMREGSHSTTLSDWRHFMAFVDAKWGE